MLLKGGTVRLESTSCIKMEPNCYVSFIDYDLSESVLQDMELEREIMASTVKEL